MPVLTFSVSAQQQIELSPKAQVSLITVAPGNELYSLFGHTALRIHDPVTGINRTYNYGTFEFDASGFYWKFALGDLQYFLLASRFGYVKEAYLNAGRTIIEQQLNLTPGQVKELYRLLEINALPKNRYYSYEFFYDNCTTRVYDIISKVIGDSFSFSGPLNPKQKSFREFINPYLEPVPWVKFGVNLLLGMPADQIPSGPETLFLPDLLKTGFAKGIVQRADTSVALVGQETIYTSPNPVSARSVFLTPALIFWLLLGVIMILTYTYPENTKLWIWFDRILFGVACLVGLLILFLWLFSAYPSTKWNLNILWSLPALPLFGVLLNTNRVLSASSKILWSIFIAIIVLFLLSWMFIPQEIPGAVFPLILLLGYRSWIRFQTKSVVSNSQPIPAKKVNM
ncbi:MAG TPA: DUF4105 domain-containing protein [Gracilimonas sp.]|uniref:Lnb N-terminal periplasmic domain-containing protein n=1 Tax=Gracilimonas sp. TaxID=1974203 RepID=UPI002DB53F1B|nr:DUF4105 domain-containing protein [Gracilimonas sp.]